MDDDLKSAFFNLFFVESLKHVFSILTITNSKIINVKSYDLMMTINTRVK